MSKMHATIKKGASLTKHLICNKERKLAGRVKSVKTKVLASIDEM